jgi:hypothetical protein
MALSYEIDSKLKALAPIVDEHSEWYNRVMRATFYPERAGDPFEPPASFATWLNDAAQDDFVGRATLEKLRKMQVEVPCNCSFSASSLPLFIWQLPQCRT